MFSLGCVYYTQLVNLKQHINEIKTKRPQLLEVFNQLQPKPLLSPLLDWKPDL